MSENHSLRNQLIGIGALILAVATGCGGERETDASSEDTPDRRTPVAAAHISDIFALEREVVLDDSVYTSGYTYLDIDTGGDFLLTDLFGRQVFLFDRNGHHQKTLSTEPCDPGFPWHPYQARFKPNGNIIVNSSQWGYEFSNDGNCIGELSDEFGFPKSMGFDDEGHMYGFYVHGQQDEGYHIRKMNGRGSPIDRFGFDDVYFSYTMRNTPVPDIIIDEDDYIYHGKIFKSKVDKYDKKGDLIAEIGKIPEYYREVQLNDSEFASGNDSRMASIEYLNKFSLTRSLWLLNNNTLMVNIQNTYNRKDNKNEEEGYVLMDMEGNVVVDILTHISFIHARNGLAYSFFDSTNSGKGLAGGPPSLKVYRYLPPS